MTAKELFDIRNTRLLGNKIYEICRTHHPDRVKNIPYSKESFLKEISRMNIYRGCSESLNEFFEAKSATMPFNIIWDLYMFHKGRIPDIDQFIEQYIKTYCDTLQNGLYTYKPLYKQREFSITYNDLRTRIYKIYFSFVREYHLYLALMEAGFSVFIDRKEDYNNRIDIGVIKDKVLYILDTSLDSRRSNMFEKRKLTTRREIGNASDCLRMKFNCRYYVRIPLKACRFEDNPMHNTQKAGKFDLYSDAYIEKLIFFIKNVKIRKNMILNESYFQSLDQPTKESFF